MANSICREAGLWASKCSLQEEVELKSKFREGKKVITDFIIDSDDGEDIGEDHSVLNGLNESELQKLCDNLDSSHKQ